MKRFLLLVLVMLSSCGYFPQSSNAPLNQYPTLMPTPTLAVVTAPIEGDRIKEAEDFFYHIKLHLASGELDHIAEEARFPITVNVEGQPKTFVYAAELGEFLPRILSPQQISRLMATDESELTYTSEGVRVLDGILWFNLFCLDAACIEPEFLITEINN